MSVICKCDFCGRILRDNEARTELVLKLTPTEAPFKNIVRGDICENCILVSNGVKMKDLQAMLLNTGKII